MIEKTIHYCWFGNNPKSELVKKCIQSWEKYCPDYKIIEWNESNFDVNLCKYTKQAYDAKKWAFVSDVARLWIIYNEGGIYLDTDVELHNNLDDLLNYSAWFASDDVRYIATGLGFGAEPKNELVKKILEDYYDREFNLSPCISLNTKVIVDNISEFKKTDKTQLIDNILFIGIHDYGKFGKHHYEFSWGTEEERKYKKERQKKIKTWKWKLQCKLRNPKLINYAESNKDNFMIKIYMFIVYDLIENGISYYIKRWTKKYITRKSD